MSTVTVETKVVRNPKMVASEMNGEIVMMNVDQGKYFSIGKSGVAIWKALDEERTVAEVVDRLRSVYEVDQATCEQEVIRFIDVMKEKDLVSVRAE